MDHEIYPIIQSKLSAGPKRLTDLEQWLFVAVNTARAIIDNTDKKRADMVFALADCGSTGQIQRGFDEIQGKFGREGFSQRYSPRYRYLCSLVADFPDQALSERDRERIRQYAAVHTYLLCAG